jgi:hypothetical protein
MNRVLLPARLRPSLSRGRGVALVISTVALGCTCAPAVAQAQGVTSSSEVQGAGSVGSSSEVQGAGTGSSSNEVQVGNANGKAALILHGLTIPQLAAILKTPQATLKAEIEAVSGHPSLELGGPLPEQLNQLLSKPDATLQEVLNLLSSHGLSAAPVEQLIGRLLGGATETPEQLRTTIDKVLAELGQSGKLEGLAKELKLPPAVVEALSLAPASVERTLSSAEEVLPLAPTTTEKLASSMSTTSGRLGSALLGAGSGTSPLAASVVPGEGLKVVVGGPAGNGGLALTVLNSSPSGASPGATAASGISNGFQILSIKVSGGVIRETVKLPGPGALAVSASTQRKVAFRSSGKHRRFVTRKATVASFRGALSGGVRTVTLRIRGAAAKVRPLVLKLSTTYTPTGGTPRTIQRSVTVGRVSKKRHG